MSNYEKLRGCLHISLQLMMKFNQYISINSRCSTSFYHLSIKLNSWHNNMM